MIYVFRSRAALADEWEIPFESILDQEWLGSGAQGVVFVGRWKSELVAVKKVKERSETNIFHLRKLNHPNIVQFRGVCTQVRSNRRSLPLFKRKL